MLLTFLKRHGCLKTNLIVSTTIVLMSVMFTSIVLLLFQGYIDTLGILIAIFALLIIFFYPAHLFFKNILKLEMAEKNYERKT